MLVLLKNNSLISAIIDIGAWNSCQIDGVNSYFNDVAITWKCSCFRFIKQIFPKIFT